MTIFFGSVFNSSAFFELITLLPSRVNPGIFFGLAPVAIMIFSA
jgi:hypothetical protein